MHPGLKWGLMSVGVVVIFVAGVSVGSSPKSSSSPQAPAPSSAPSAKTSTAPQPEIAKVGQRVESAGVALTVDSISRMQASGVFKPKAGNVYLAAMVTVENTSRDKAPYNPMYFKVKDSGGFEYTVALNGDSQALKSGELAAGEKARGTIMFDVPQGASGFVMSYQPLVILGGYKVIRIAVD